MKKLILSVMVLSLAGFANAMDIDVNVQMSDFVNAKEPGAVVQKNKISVDGKSYEFNTTLEDMMDAKYSVSVVQKDKVKEDVKSKFTLNMYKNSVTTVSSIQEMPVMNKMYSNGVHPNEKTEIALKKEALDSFVSVLALREDEQKGLVVDYGVNKKDLVGTSTFMQENNNDTVGFVLPSFKEKSFFFKDVPVELGKDINIVDNEDVVYTLQINKI